MVRGNGLSIVNRTNAGAFNRVILGQSSGKCRCASSRCSSDDSRRDPIGQYSMRSAIPRKFNSLDTRSRSEISRFKRLFSRAVRARYGFPSPAHNKKTAGTSGIESSSEGLAINGARMFTSRVTFRSPHCAKTGTAYSVPRRHNHSWNTPNQIAAWTEWAVPAFAPCDK